MAPDVLFIPPLLMPRQVMIPLLRRIERRGHRCFLFGYPSYRCDIPENARRLAAFLAERDVGELDVVAFSLGSIVLRWAVNHHPMPRLRRVVMIGPPNRGASMAELADRWTGPVFPLVWGRCARQLRPGSDGLCDRAGLLPESTELAIIAGGRGNPRGVNPFLEGDNDRVVRVVETWLPGMADFKLVRAAHGPLIFRRDVAGYCARFLQTGALRKEGERKLPSGFPTDQSLPMKA
ncbi:MAG: alpha/beta hydrolase [Candidatus Sumerlaeia bacterium]|nr:alpha/beta hydrolase [Candidatus Sumerlaeia bacterium]